MKSPLVTAFGLSLLVLCSAAFIIEHTSLPRTLNSRILNESRIISDFPVSYHFNLRNFASPDTHETEIIPYLASPDKFPKKTSPKDRLVFCSLKTSERVDQVRGAPCFCYLRAIAARCHASAFSPAISAKLGFESRCTKPLVYLSHVHFARGESVKCFGRCNLKGISFDIYHCGKREDECSPGKSYLKVGEHSAGIVFNTLFYHTSEDDLVVNPMAGGDWPLGNRYRLRLHKPFMGILRKGAGKRCKKILNRNLLSEKS